MTNPLRTIAAILGGTLIMVVLVPGFEAVLVNAFAETPPDDLESYLAVRNRTGVLVATLVAHTLAALLTGYVLAKIAGAQEVRHAIGAAVLILANYAAAMVSDNPMLWPAWVLVCLASIVPLALVAGAHVRGEARMIRESAELPRSDE